MNIRIGDICKFEDFEPFEGRRNCFKIGQVTEIKGVWFLLEFCWTSGLERSSRKVVWSAKR